MYGKHRIFLLIYIVAVAIPISLAFNIDVTDPDVYKGKQTDFFGYKVLQFKSDTDKGIIISAPLQLNGSGGICKPDQNHSYQCFNHDLAGNDNTSVKYFGLSITEDSKHSNFIACSPNVVNECYGSPFVNGMCQKITHNLKPTSALPSDIQECTKKQVDLVFLFDGSKSMSPAEFDKNKEFIMDIVKTLKNSSIKFAAVQFSSEYVKVFDFNDYENGIYIKKLNDERQLLTLTNTHKALTYVMDRILENPDAGATADATKVLVVITDGDPSDSDTNGIMKKYNDKKIIRFVIAVKDVDISKFEDIASIPQKQYVFKIEQYTGLKGILENFQKKIFDIEGTTVSRADSLTTEMSQSGFSTAFHNDVFIRGAVGSNSWRGSLQNIYQQEVTQIEDPEMKKDSYMGYSLSVGERDGAALYFTGAPRFNHTGQVVFFKQEDRTWKVADRINGEKIGSYFGASVCSVDVNLDGNTDFLMVGAPMFYQTQVQKEGRIYIYKLTKELKLEPELNVTAPSMGRFGMTISSLADLNGDGLREVAVGAPLEDDGRGTVYIYLGDKQKGIRSTFSQRIKGEQIKTGLRFFGQAIDGRIDLGEDGLPDILIGSQGTVVVLRSTPILDVKAHLSFLPKEISTDKIDCSGRSDEILSMVTITVCFEMVAKTVTKEVAMNISYMLAVDPLRQTNHRGFFSKTDKKAKTLTLTSTLMDNETCFHRDIYMPKCVKDTLSPVSIKLNFFQVDSENASAILNIDSVLQAVAEVPFEKHCKSKDKCIAELEVDFNFMTPTLLVENNNYFNVTVKLSNVGDDSYATSLIMQYPPGLDFSRMTLVEATRPIIHSCEDGSALDNTTCGVSRPVFRSGSAATFRASFRIINEYEWNDTISMTIMGKSENTNSTSAALLTKTIPVQYEIKMAVMVKEDLVTYMNFTTLDAGPKKLVATYKIENLGFKEFPINVSLFFPTKLEYNFEMTNFEVFVQQNYTQCTSITDKTSEYCSAEKHCKIIVCDTFILERASPIEFTLSGDVQFRDLMQQAEAVGYLEQLTETSHEVKFRSFIHVNYDKQRYVLDSDKKEEKSNGLTMKSTEVRVELIFFRNTVWLCVIGGGLGLLFLIILTIILYKCGCFRRKSSEDFENQERASLKARSNQSLNQVTSDQQPEAKTLLDGNVND